MTTLKQNKKFKILILGPQGSGKGTQGRLLSEKLKVPYFALGNILRKRIQRQDELARELAGFMNRGLLAPDNIVNQITLEQIIKPHKKTGYILDGHPRNLDQVKFIEKWDHLTQVIEIHISDQEAISRIEGRRTCRQCQAVYHIKHKPPRQENVCDQCGGRLGLRTDHDRQTLKKRLAIYHRYTQKVLDYYRQQGILFEINGEQPIDKVHQDILEKIQ